MKIPLSDIEPILAQRIRDEEQQITKAIRQLGGATPFIEGPLPGWTPLHEIIKGREKAKVRLQVLTVLGSPIIVLSLMVWLGSLSSRINLGDSGLTVACLILFGLVYFVYRYFQHRISQTANHRFVALGLPLVARSKEEKLYCNLVEELSKARGETERTAQSLLREMNALMGSYRVLEQRFEDSTKALGNRSLDSWEAERDSLRQRAEVATDPVTREALAQSVQLCASHIESAKALTLMQERAKVQQEVVLQTLGSVHAAFVHMRNAPNDVHFESEHLVETVNDLQSRTRAVEQAVQEVVNLHRHS